MHANTYINNTPIAEKLPAKGLCHPEQRVSLKSQHGCCPFWNADPQEEELGWNSHYRPGGWSVPVPPIKHLYHKTQENRDRQS